MTINELLDFYKWKYEQAKDFTDPHWEATEKREHREYIERLKATIEMLEELKWYKDNKLILRNAPIEIIRTSREIASPVAKLSLMSKMIRIPKAKPPKE